MGGTFDPIHDGHLVVARSVAEQLGLERVLFIPTGNPNFKQGLVLAPACERLRMVELAIAGDPLFELDTCEVDRGGVTYTADTLADLRERYPQAGLVFIMGTDSAITLPGWKRARDVAASCTIAVARRPGQSTRRLREALADSPIAFDIAYLDVPQVDVSSTQVRNALAQGDGIDGMVPRAVADYIFAHGLYESD